MTSADNALCVSTPGKQTVKVLLAKGLHMCEDMDMCTLVQAVCSAGVYQHHLIPRLCTRLWFMYELENKFHLAFKRSQGDDSDGKCLPAKYRSLSSELQFT